MSLKKNDNLRISIKLYSGNRNKEFYIVKEMHKQLNELGVKVSDSKIEGDFIQLIGLVSWAASPKPFTIAKVVKEVSTEAGFKTAEIIISKIIDKKAAKSIDAGAVIGSLLLGPLGIVHAALAAATGGAIGGLVGVTGCEEEVIYEE